jgi:HD-GYP domain-containing protein (c-di-GMP phosphodiesterase class II)
MHDVTGIDERELDAALRRPGRLTRAERRWHVGSGLVLAMLAVAVAVLAPPTRETDAVTLVLCVVLMAIACRVEFDLPRGALTVPLQAVFVPMLLLLPPAVVTPAVVVAFILGRLPDILRGQAPVSRLMICISNAWFAIGPAFLFAAAGDPVDVRRAAALLPAAVAVQIVVDFWSSALRERAVHASDLKGQLADSAWVYVVDLLLTPLGLMAALAAADHPRWLILLVGPFAILGFFAGERRRRLEQLQELNRAYRGTALVLGDVIEGDDAYTGAHSRGVVTLSLEVGAKLRLSDHRLRNLEFGALLHDVGKVAVPNAIINKPGPLDQAEWALMRTHTIAGQEMLERIGGFMREVGVIVRASHERWDGGGYPDGLAGEAIPLEARVIAVCDTYHAMTTTRSYRPALSHDAAVAELRRCAGSQFDSAIVDAALAALEPEWVATAGYAAASSPTSASLARK